MAKKPRKRKNRRERQKLGSQLVKVLVLIIALGIIYMLFFSGSRSLIKWFKASREKQQLQQDIEQLEEKKTSLDSQRTRLENDPEYIEKIAREQYNMKKKGEKVYKVVPEEN